MKLIKMQCLLALLLSSVMVAQQTVSGLVTDAEGTPLPGATVIVQGTSNGVTSDFDGKYSINVERGQTLEASFIGYQSNTVLVEDQDQINLSLEQDNELDEVVVIGYGEALKKDLTGTLDVVNSENFTKCSVVSAQPLIQ
jgi:hypothetical protein